MYFYSKYIYIFSYSEHEKQTKNVSGVVYVLDSDPTTPPHPAQYPPLSEDDGANARIRGFNARAYTGEAKTRMKKQPVRNSLQWFLLSHLLLRFFLPLSVFITVLLITLGLLGLQVIGNQQKELVQSQARVVDRFLDQATRIIDAVGRMTEVSDLDQSRLAMESAKAAYHHFDTLVLVGEDNRVLLTTPHLENFQGLDMSRMPYAQNFPADLSVTVSSPFISTNTGTVAVILTRPLRGGRLCLRRTESGDPAWGSLRKPRG